MTGGKNGVRPGDLAWGGAIAAAVAVAVVLRGDVVKTTLTSPAALSRLAALVVALVALSWVLRRFVDHAALRGLVMAVPLAAIGWFLVVPYFTDEKVVESLPGAASTTVAAVAAPTVVAPTPAPVPAPAPTPAPAPATTVAPAGPVLLSVGDLAGIGHRASGSAALYRLVDGSHIVRLEDIDIQNGPDYFVHLVPGANRESPGDGHDLGALKGNRGSQNYEVPAEVDVSAGPFTVLVWCRAFSVPVANATPQPV